MTTKKIKTVLLLSLLFVPRAATTVHMCILNVNVVLNKICLINKKHAILNKKI